MGDKSLILEIAAMNVEAQTYFDSLGDYEYINKDGRLDLELFIAHLSMCFFYDLNGAVGKNPNPNLVYQSLIELIKDEFTATEAERYIQLQNLKVWSPNNPVYRQPVRTLIHISALVKVQHLWINNIGTAILGIPQEENAPYYGWVKPEWVFVKKFLEGYHEAHWGFIKEFDSQQKQKTGVSLIESLALSIKKDMPFEDALDEIESVGLAKNDAIVRIEVSIEQGFYLEAITLQECLFTHLFLSYLDAKKVKPKSNSLHDVLDKSISKKNHCKEENLALFKSVDAWRKQRNQAVHGYVAVRKKDSNKTHDDFMQSSKETALTGQTLLKDAIKWYEGEAKNFLDTTSPVKAPTLAIH